MIQYLIVTAIVLVAMVFWLNRLLPAQAARLKSRIGLGAPHVASIAGQNAEKSCSGCSGCKGGGCH